MRTIAFCAASAALFVGCGSQADDAGGASPGAWTVDSAKSSLEFTATQAGKSFTGAFGGFDADIVLDPDDLSGAHINVSVDTGSAKTGDRQRDDALPSADWFASKAFPTATYESDEIVSAGAGAYEAHGVLTLKGVSKPLTLPFTLEVEDGRAVADGAVSLVRTDFKVGEGEFSTDEWVGFDVAVTFHIEATH